MNNQASKVNNPFPNVPNDPARNWEEDYSHENGKYQNKCHECGELFFGHKRRITCKVCAENKDETAAIIEKEAEEYADSIDRRGCAFWRGLNMGYIAGRTRAEQELAAYREEIETTAFETNSYVIMLREENRKLREALNDIASENYDDDDKKRHLKAIIDRMKSTANALIDSYTDKEKQ